MVCAVLPVEQKDLIKNDAGNEFSFVLIKIILWSTNIPMQPTKAVF